MGQPNISDSRRKNVNAVVDAASRAEKERLRREDHLRVKHDKLFSDWKILLGPADWKDHDSGEEGSQRYRIHNLPSTYFGPGVYELGLTIDQGHHNFSPRAANGIEDDVTKTGKKVRRHAVVVVYLGKADNVRQRLQRYGQTGSHLEGFRSGPPRPDVIEIGRGGLVDLARLGAQKQSANISGGLKLFTEVFTRGYSIAFRWAKTETKKIAEKVESELLHVFDYPWNASLNGARRSRDILVKMEAVQNHGQRSSLCLGRALGGGICWRQWEHVARKVGIPVAARKPLDEIGARRNFFAPITRATGTSPGAIHAHSRANKGGSERGEGRGDARFDSTPMVCGILLDDGTTCSSPPVKGRKRCTVHKGLRTKRSITITTSTDKKGKCDRRNDSRTILMTPAAAKPLSGTTTTTKKVVELSAGDQSPASATAPTTVVTVVRARMNPKGSKRVEISSTMRRATTDEALEVMPLPSSLVACGAISKDGGSPCSKLPVPGRKRCALHKGLHVTSLQ